MKTHHPRDAAFRDALTRVQITLNDVINEHDLTFGEVFRIIADLNSRWSHHLLSDERTEPSQDDKASIAALGDKLT